jgi:subtilisin family serine protease
VVLPTDEEVAQHIKNVRESSLKILQWDEDGWDDLWIMLQRAHDKDYQFDPNDKAKDTDGDGFSDYEEMLTHRNATHKEPVYTKEEQIARIREERRQAIINAKHVAEAEKKRRDELAPLIIPPLTTKDGRAASAAEVDAEKLPKLAALARKNTAEAAAAERRADAFAQRHGIAKDSFGPNGEVSSLVDVVDGVPQFNVTHNAVAADSISTDEVRPGGSLGLNLTGTGTTVGVWDGGDVLLNHQEFTSGGQRVTDKDGVSTLGVNFHATHVSGTMAAKGVNTSARGMAYNASVHAYDWTGDLAEMPTAAGTDSLRLSNHSYGRKRGWDTAIINGINSWVWFGDTTVSQTEDYRYGFYDTVTRDVDVIAYDAPHYLPIWSAGNERGFTGPAAQPVGHWAFVGDSNIQWVTTISRPLDGGATGMDLLSGHGVAKNVLTIAAVEDLTGGYTSAPAVLMSTFSSFGGCDDGRIKPDISANGVGLNSTLETATNAYGSLSGTSMAAPSVAGSLALLREHFTNLFGASPFWASTIKALVIHTADESGIGTGPDYRFGWGLQNTKSAAALLTAQQGSGAALRHLKQTVLQNTDFIEFQVRALGGQPLKVTIVWTDPAGTVPAKAVDVDLDTTKALVNDLDLRVFAGATEHFPWKLDPANPSNAATRTTDNKRDNVEQVQVDAPTGGQVFTVRVTHKGTLKDDTGATAPQAVSMILSGVAADAAPDFKIHDISATGTNEHTITWRSVVGATYRLETSAELTTGTWTELSGDFVATKEFTSAEVSNANGEERRFWRVKRLP